jgi:uncharacterized membrane protein YraQ (UPF0718 family)
MAKLLPDARPGTILKAAGLGSASSSCSYAATAIARAIVKQGGDFRAAMAFQFASTNLVVELGLILWSLPGWRFTLAQFAGGFIMIAVLAVLFRLFLKAPMIDAAAPRRALTFKASWRVMPRWTCRSPMTVRSSSVCSQARPSRRAPLGRSAGDRRQGLSWARRLPGASARQAANRKVCSGAAVRTSGSPRNQTLRRPNQA